MSLLSPNPASVFPRRQWFKPVAIGPTVSERSVVVITGRCQRLNPGSSPGARTLAVVFAP